MIELSSNFRFRFRHHNFKMVLRTESESSDFADLELAGVEPLTLEDIVIGESYVNTEMVRYVENTLRFLLHAQSKVGMIYKSTYRKNGVNNLMSRCLYLSGP